MNLSVEGMSLMKFTALKEESLVIIVHLLLTENL